MTILASALAGEIVFGVYIVAALVLIFFVIRFARSLGRGKR
jgi:hypothetical protein